MQCKTKIKEEIDVPTWTHLIKFRSLHFEFRLPELLSLYRLSAGNEDLECFDREQAKHVSSADNEFQSPFLPAKFQSEEQIRFIASRSVSTAAFYLLFGMEDKLDVLAERMGNIEDEKVESLCRGKSFKFIIDSFGKKYEPDEQKEILAKFQYFPVWRKATLDLDQADLVFSIMIDHGRCSSVKEPRKVYFGLKLAQSNVGLIDRLKVTKRQYIGTTSMDSELSWLMANQALARKGSLIFDPFVGTGSLLLTCAMFGSMTCGADIDKRILDGCDENHNVYANFEQLGLKHLLLDLLACDHAHPVWESLSGRTFFDAIVCDPPYGVRAGARKIGKKNKAIRRELHHPKPKQIVSRVPQCVSYSIQEVCRDLLAFAARMLNLNGRLVYWLPTTDKYKESDLPLHPCLKVIENSEQPLSMRHRRRLITMEKIREYKADIHENLPIECYGQLNLTEGSHSHLRAYWMSK